MKGLVEYIKESILNEEISDNFKKKYHGYTKSSDPVYRQTDYWMKHIFKDKDEYYNADKISDEEFVNHFVEVWGPGEDEFRGEMAVDKYLRVTYGVKLLEGGLSGGREAEGHYGICVVPLDSKKRTGEFKGYSEFDVGYVYNGGSKDYVKWEGDVKSLKEYAEAILKYIKDVMK